MRKRPFFILIVIACFIVCGCSKQDYSTASINIIAEETPQSTTDKTATLKELSFQNFEGKTMGDILADEAGDCTLDFDKFFNLAGLSYDFVSNDIVVMPIGYNEASDFAIQIHSQSNGIVSGYTVNKIRETDGSWRESYRFNSATDFIFDMLIDGHNYRIGADAMDSLWREVRVLTAPEDKVEVVNTAVDAELASYYELPEDFPEE